MWTQDWVNYHQNNNHQIVLCLNVPKINYSESDSRNLNPHWLLSCVELNYLLICCLWRSHGSLCLPGKWEKGDWEGQEEELCGKDQGDLGLGSLGLSLFSQLDKVTPFWVWCPLWQTRRVNKVVFRLQLWGVFVLTYWFVCRCMCVGIYSLIIF